METNEMLSLIPALLAGIVLGVLFFGGLWLTVRQGLNSIKPYLLFIVSLILRMAIVVFGFYYIGADNWKRMIACLVGFLIARILMTFITKKDKQVELVNVKEEIHEN